MGINVHCAENQWWRKQYAIGEGGLRDECVEHAYCRGIWGMPPPKKN